jgi:hypothetical protein
MIIYHVTDESGEMIMNAPLDTISRAFTLTLPAVARLLHETKELMGRCTLTSNNRQRSDLFYYWRKIQVQRLPLEIPRQAE